MFPPPAPPQAKEPKMNKYEQACTVFFTGCTNSNDDHPELCPECLEGFRHRIVFLMKEDHPGQLNRGAMNLFETTTQENNDGTD